MLKRILLDLEPRKGLRQIIRHAIVQNVMALSAAQVATYVFPLVTIPYLARVLGVTGWGLVAFAQAFGAHVALLVEYGFPLSATREVSRHRCDNERLAEITAGVLGAKGVFAILGLAAALGARWLVPIFRSHPDLLWASTFWALAQAFNMMWLFQGLERMKLVAGLDFSAKAVATTGIFLLVRTPSDGWKVLVLQGLGALVSFLVSLWFAYRYVPFRVPGSPTVASAIRMGWSMFVFRSSASFYTVGNAFILGLFVSPVFVGYYAGAEKISRAFISLLNPMTQTIFPRISHLIHTAREQAIRLARTSLIVMGLGGCFMGALILMFAPIMVRIILGHVYAPAVPVLRIFSLLPPLIAVSSVLGIQWMLPMGLDRAFNTIILLAGVVNLSLALMLAPGLKASGMAWAVVTSELFVTGAMFFLLRWRGLEPSSRVMDA